MKAHRVLGAHEDHPVKGIQVKVLGLVIELLVELLAILLGLVGQLEELGSHRGLVAGSLHQGDGAVLNGDDLASQPLRGLGVALLAGHHIILQGTGDVVIRDLVGPHLDVGVCGSRRRRPRPASERCCGCKTHIRGAG